MIRNGLSTNPCNGTLRMPVEHIICWSNCVRLPIKLPDRQHPDSFFVFEELFSCLQCEFYQLKNLKYAFITTDVNPISMNLRGAIIYANG